MPIEQQFHMPLFRIASSKMIDEDAKISYCAEWLADNANKVTEASIKASFKRAGRDDLIPYFIKEVDIKVGDTVRSRTTGRFGKVRKIHWDNETVVVAWSTGGQQALSKGSLQKMSNVDDKGVELKDFSNVKTEFDSYGNMIDSKKQEISFNSPKEHE